MILRSLFSAVTSLGFVGMSWNAATAVQDIVSVLPITDVEIAAQDPYQYTTTWTDESGNTYKHTTITNPDGSSVELHYINDSLVGTLYADLNGGWTFLDGNGELLYEDVWEEKLGDYKIIFGKWATWMDFDTEVLQPMNFWGGPSIYFDVITLESGGGIVYMTASASDFASAQTPVYGVSASTDGLLTALRSINPVAFKARAQILSLLSSEPKAPKATPVKGQKREAGSQKRHPHKKSK